MGRSVWYFTGVIILGLAIAAGAQDSNFDRRLSVSSGQASPNGAQLDALEGLRDRLGGSILVSFDSTTGVTRSLVNPTGPLTGPTSGDASEIARSFVSQNRGLLGLESGDMNEMAICDRVYSRVSGVTHVYYCQSYRGIPIFNARLQLNVRADGTIGSVSNAFVPGLRSLERARSSLFQDSGRRASGIDETNNPAPAISAADAIVAAAIHLGVRPSRRPRKLRAAVGVTQRTSLRAEEVSRETIPANLIWLPVGGGLRLAWSLEIATRDGRHVYAMSVDATEGLDLEDPTRVLTRFDLVSDSSYLVYPSPVESPNHTSPDPPADGRVVVDDPFDAGASPLGWHDTGTQSFQTMRGNNVHAYDDGNFDNQPPATEPVCPGGNCSFAVDLTDDPQSYTTASIANVFYWTNLVHDIQYRYGFDEIAGNFQVGNFGRGGAGGDALKAEIQDGSGLNNANMLTPPDGSPPRMQMFVWNHTSPRADSALDAGVIVHEYGHGISNRLVGGPSNVLCLSNLQQPGEGLSDFWALVYTAKPTDTALAPRGIASYLLGQPVDGTGLRTQPYSLDPTINTHTYESIAAMAVPHGVGEVWAQAAWEVYWALIEQHGFDSNLANASGNAGNQRMMLYVNEGLKNTACSPSFTDVRNGIIQAASSLHGGEDVCLLWHAFADFGLGVDALSGGSSSTSPTNGFNVPAACVPGPHIVTPSPGTILPSTDVTFSWEPNGEDVFEYELWVGTSAGASDLFSSADLGTALSLDVTGLPADGRALFVRLRFLIGGVWDFRDYTYQAKVSDPAISTPEPGSSFEGTQVTFEWNDGGTPVLNYWLYVGTSVGGRQILDTGSLGKDTVSFTVDGLPTDGSTIQVRLWWFLQVGGWRFADFTYVATDLPIPELEAPLPGTKLSGSSATFTWTSNGASVESWQLLLGSTAGAQDYFASAVTTAVSIVATGLPMDGSTIHARLRYQLGGQWSFRDFQYTANVGPPELFAPPPGAELPGPLVTFEWRTTGAVVVEWWLYVGSSVGGRDILDSGSLGTQTSVRVSNIPTDGRVVHVQLWYRLAGQAWKSDPYVYTAAVLDVAAPEITSPTPGSTLTGNSATFEWNANGTAVAAWWLYVGTSPKGRNIYDSGNLGALTSVTVSGLPTDGRTLFATLWYLVAGKWELSVFDYKTPALAPTITSPPPGSVLSGASATFMWEANPNAATVSAWSLYLGRTTGGTHYFNSGTITTSSATLATLPTDGSAIHARLWYRVNSTWSYRDFPFVAATVAPPSIVSPTPGSVLPGSTATLTWEADPNFQLVTEWWLYAGGSPGARNYFDSRSLGSSRTVTVSGLPLDGSFVHVRLWYKSFGQWLFRDFVYSAGS